MSKFASLPVRSTLIQSILFLAAVAIVNVPLAAQVAPGHEAAGLSGRRAPSFALQDSNMQERDILDYRGHWLLIDFMRTDCPHCKGLTKLLEATKEKNGLKISVLSIVLAPPETQVTVGKYIAENKVTGPILFDMGQVAIAYFKASPQRPSFDTPHLFAVNPQGIIVKDWTQAGVEQPGFLAELQQLIDGKK